MGRHALSSRREFLTAMGLFGSTLFVSRGLVACQPASGSESVMESDHALVSCEPPKISANHGHVLVLPPEDVAAAVQKTYSIRGAATHDHSVTITAEQFAELALGRSVTVLSTTAGTHTHT